MNQVFIFGFLFFLFFLYYEYAEKKFKGGETLFPLRLKNGTNADKKIR